MSAVDGERQAAGAVSRRLAFAWVVIAAYGILLAGVFLLVMRHSAGPGYGYTGMAVVKAIIWGIFSPRFSLLLGLWLGGVWLMFRHRTRSRSRAWIALVPAMAFLLYQFGGMMVAPPSPAKYFRDWFGVPLPGDARSIEVAHPTLADPGFVEFAFTCSRESSQLLIERLAMEPSSLPPRAFPNYFRVGADGERREEGTQQGFVRIDADGTGYLLVFDAGRERVLVARNPLLAKSKRESSRGNAKTDDQGKTLP